MDLNNREIAALVWLAIFSGCVASNSRCRNAFLDVLRILFSPKIVQVIFSTLIWVCVSVFILSSLGSWGFDNLKTTVIWTIFFAFAEVFNINKIRDDKWYFKKIIISVFGVPTFFTFFMNYFSFSLTVEFFIVPITVVITFAQHTSKGMRYGKLITVAISICLAIILLSVVTNSVYNAYVNFHQVAKISTIIEFLTPMLLSIFFIPYMFILHATFTYESRYVAIRHFINNESLHRYALRRAILAFGLNFELLQQWVFNLGETRPTDRASIDHSIRTVKNAALRQF